MEGRFVVYKNPNEEFDIKFEINPKYSGDIPQDQQELYEQIESTCNAIKALENTDVDTKHKYFNKLLSLSQGGLVSDNAQPLVAKRALEQLKNEIVLVEGKRIKNLYMKILGEDILVNLFLLSPMLVCYLLPKLKSIACAYMAIMGALVGMWVSFGARKFEITFDDLTSLEKDKMTPFIRIIYIGVVTLIFMLLLAAGVLNIRIGSIETTTVFTDMNTAVVIGLICGLVESKIGVGIYNKVTTIIGETGI